ncbi:hypothetical protein G6F46_014096 [Rhizopus delemar]|nr:hypothetical protein G6F46_014096 [Rhizopus delemar]
MRPAASRSARRLVRWAARDPRHPSVVNAPRTMAGRRAGGATAAADRLRLASRAPGGASADAVGARRRSAGSERQESPA